VCQISRPKDSYKKIFKIYQHVCSYEKSFTIANFDTLPRIDIFLPWSFCHETISMLITCVPNFKAKIFTQNKIFESYQHVSLWGKFSLLSTLTPSQGLKIVFSPWIFGHKTISMLIICVPNIKVKRFIQKRYSNSTNMCLWEWFFTIN